MTRLRDWKAPAPHASVGPHQARLVGGRVLVTGLGGRAVFLARDEYSRFLAGLSPGDPLRGALAPLGALSDQLDFDAQARALAAGGESGWRGPRRHVLLVSAGGEQMSVPAAKRAVDAAFSTPRPELELELVVGGACPPAAARFAAAYARRRAEWGRRGLALTVRAPVPLEPAAAAFFAGHGAAARALLFADGPPAGVFPAASALVQVGAGAREPEAWVDALAARGIKSARFEPSPGRAAARRFAAFYARALARMVERHERSDLRDEAAPALLAARPWDLPGIDLFECLAYSPDGRVFSSEAGWELARAGDVRFELGTAEAFRFPELAAHPATAAIAASVHRDAQPLCASCVYRPYCAIAPSALQAEQGTFWGRLPESGLCAARMGALDALFGRLEDDATLRALEKWGVDLSKLIA